MDTLSKKLQKLFLVHNFRQKSEVKRILSMLDRIWRMEDLEVPGSTLRNRRKKKGKDFLLKRQAKAYARKSTIHGLNYVAEPGRPSSEG